VGYFPTYTLGNLMSYQIWKSLTVDLPDFESDFAKGDFSGVLAWLGSRIYRHGKTYPPADLMTRVTGKPMDADGWLDLVPAKYRRIYDLG